MTAVRAAGPGDVERLREIERAAGEPFRALGMDAVADDEPPAAAVLGGFVDRGCAWVVDGGSGGDAVPVAYLLAGLVDGDAHLEQVSVHPSHARLGLGRRLLDHLADRARGRGAPAIILTTFTDVPWNGPYYRQLGFRVLADEQLGPGLRAIRAAEAARGLDRWPRAAMRREL